MERFISKVEKTESCWIWKAGYSGDGYGTFWHNKKQIAAHRASFIFFNGEIPIGLLIRHKCDNSKCVNPEHLELGTVKDNMKDKLDRDRQPRGSKHNNSKLTEEQIISIRNKYNKSNISYRSLAKEYNVSSPHIINIIKNKCWKHIVNE